MGFPDHATFKLVEMNGAGWGETAASLHLTGRSCSKQAAALYLPAAVAANPELQDLVVLLALVAMQQEYNRRRNASNSAAASGAASSGAAAAGASC